MARTRELVTDSEQMIAEDLIALPQQVFLRCSQRSFLPGDKKLGSSWNRVGDFRHVLIASQRGQHAGEDLESKVFFITEPVGAALEDADLVVQTLDEPERDLVLRAAVGGDPIPRLFYHLVILII